MTLELPHVGSWAMNAHGEVYTVKAYHQQWLPFETLVELDHPSGPVRLGLAQFLMYFEPLEVKQP